MSCTTLDEKLKTGTCTFQAWYNYNSFIHRAHDSKGFPKGYMAQSIDCAFTNCSMKILPRGDVRAECLHTKCVCGEADKCKKPISH
jgi:hypothetical protein